MTQLDNEKFGAFVADMRKKKGWTQKELADRLFVSDKAVSKWERGLSIPNAALLMPLAEVLEVSVTELLRGELLEKEQQLENSQVETLVTQSLDLSLQENIKSRKKRWRAAFGLSAALTVLVVCGLYRMGLTTEEMKDNVLLFSGMMLGFGAWFCFFAKEVLPAYYDENKIGYYAEGIFRIHVAGLRFNNSNWGPICTAMKSFLLSAAVLYPLFCLCAVMLAGAEILQKIGKPTVLLAMLVMFAVLFVVGKKYE